MSVSRRRPRVDRIATAALTLSAWLRPTPAAARPVTYVDGWSVMSENRSTQNELMVDYTFTRSLAIGLRASSYRTPSGDVTAVAPVANLLAARWNGETTQANLYAGGGYGLFTPSPSTPAVARPVPEGSRARRYGGLMLLDADVESRVLYASARLERSAAPWPEALTYGRVRAGMSPFLGDVASLHVWTLLQWDYAGWRKQAELTPMLRFFYQNMLWEIGVGSRGNAQLNWTFEL